MLVKDKEKLFQSNFALNCEKIGKKPTILVTVYTIYGIGLLMVYNNECLITSVCVCVGEWSGQQNLSMMDRQ